MIAKNDYVPENPYKWEKVKERFLKALRQGATRGQACKRCAVDTETVRRWGRNAEIEAQMAAAEEEFFDMLEEAVLCKDVVKPTVTEGGEVEMIVNPDRALKILQTKAEGWRVKTAVEHSGKLSIMELIEGKGDESNRLSGSISDIDAVE